MIGCYGGEIGEAAGVPDQSLTDAIKLGITKVNIDTDLRMAMTAAVRKVLSSDAAEIEPMTYLGAGRDLVKKQVEHKIDVLGSAGKADLCR